MKKILTIRGPIDPTEVGPTLMHEHLIVDLSCNFVHPADASARSHLHAPVTIEMLALLRRRPFSVTLDNMVLGDEALACEEVARFHDEGGQTVVDATCIGIGRDPRVLHRISRASDLHVVMGAGCYMENSHPDWVRDASVEQLTEIFARDVAVGVEGTPFRSGIIGEIGTSGVPKGSHEKDGDITAQEEKVLRAAGRAARATGVAVSVHLDLRGQGAFRIIDILQDEGVEPQRMVMGHMDLVPDLDYHRAVLKRGAVVEYDCFGREYYTDELGGLSWGHDSWRVAALTTLVNEGYVEQLVLSQDVALKMDLCKYGGNGYGHVLRTIVPWLRREGVTDDELVTMLVENPRRILTIDWNDDVFDSPSGVLAVADARSR